MTTDKYDLGYLPTYRRIAEDLGPAATVCEVGVWQGGSLRLWQQLFPEGTVVGVDHDLRSSWPEGTVSVVSDQADPALPEKLAEHGPFDLIVEDASHQGHLSRATFDLLWPLCRGYYVIEDWQISFWPGWSDSMLRMAEGLLQLLEHPGLVVTYRHGQIIIRAEDV